MRRWWLSCFLVLALASPWAEAQDIATGSPPSASSDSSRSNGSAMPTSGLSGSAPQTPIDVWQNLENEWLGFTTEWDAFWPELQALGIGLGELPSYWKSLDESLRQEREARETDALASADREASLASERDGARREAAAWRAGALASSSVAAVALALLAWSFTR